MVSPDTMHRAAENLRDSARRAWQKAVDYTAQQERYALEREAEADEVDARADQLRLNAREEEP